MKSINKNMLLFVLDVAVDVGIPAVINAIEMSEKENISEQDIADLRKKIKEPEKYF